MDFAGRLQRPAIPLKNRNIRNIRNIDIFLYSYLWIISLPYIYLYLSIISIYLIFKVSMSRWRRDIETSKIKCIIVMSWSSSLCYLLFFILVSFISTLMTFISSPFLCIIFLPYRIFTFDLSAFKRDYIAYLYVSNIIIRLYMRYAIIREIWRSFDI